ncbi:MAG: peptide chain release factor H [Candidatus Sericytochromatia bacterium]
MKNWIKISSGRGPEECCIFISKIIPLIQKEAFDKGFKIEVLDIEKSSLNNLKSVFLSIEGENLDTFKNEWEGTLKWVYESNIRKGHKRKNWFISVSFLELPKDTIFNSNEIEIETMRSSGKGGQNVNKLETAVRVKHLATGLIAIAKEERSQLMNKKLAIFRLKELIEKNNDLKKEIFDKKTWQLHNNLERGNEKKVFIGDF